MATRTRGVWVGTIQMAVPLIPQVPSLVATPIKRRVRYPPLPPPPLRLPPQPLCPQKLAVIPRQSRLRAQYGVRVSPCQVDLKKIAIAIWLRIKASGEPGENLAWAATRTFANREPIALVMMQRITTATQPERTQPERTQPGRTRPNLEIPADRPTSRGAALSARARPEVRAAHASRGARRVGGEVCRWTRGLPRVYVCSNAGRSRGRQTVSMQY